MSRSSLSIALLTYATKPRGSVIHTLELATALTALGHHVCVYALDKDGKGFERSLPFPTQLVPAQDAPKDIDVLIQQRIQEFIGFFTAHPHHHDIYHAQDCIGANALIQLRQSQTIPHVVRTVHHVEDFQSPYLQQCQDRSIQEPDLCLCVSDRWQQALQKEYYIEAPRVLNGVDLNRFSPELSGQEIELQKRYGLNDSPTYLTVGGIEPRKNSLRLLQAFAQVLRSHPQAQLVIAGGATLFDYQPYRDQFFQLADQFNIAVGRSLILPGVVTNAELPALYRCADVFCFPSTTEGWGLVVLEAIASHLPVILSNQPPFTEFLSTEQALFVEPEDEDAIALAMQSALDPRLAQTLITNSYTILQNYTWKKSAQLHLQHYQALLYTR
ncbi:GDP-mannose-dependent alpha-(1-6)-phosphatidylinositol monomannoside mannosyltransferase [Acaryochloris thomasi RCC1774]|uniref:GDP-mannose-dependent alpha-(1-6)-phosphatidylinositol monomannoside mannosyltransferase n=1 Tax=Acaryochloris thomasi RCC1774 TaxID=1764569 RepID=A0A2W1JLE9_9CYAN|nr:MSMEG_0565 family glycosyltransferase [Acaryochloris thomasi]PZD74188.1 GDP-mannose-dependent alpha-(1-6)-phosphatidylinositol monomannoside mannosyltransferase [Acaryochloris thomasi RCC1774]